MLNTDKIYKNHILIQSVKIKPPILQNQIGCHVYALVCMELNDDS